MQAADGFLEELAGAVLGGGARSGVSNDRPAR